MPDEAEAEAGVRNRSSRPSNVPDMRRDSVSCVGLRSIGPESALISLHVARKTPRAR